MSDLNIEQNLAEAREKLAKSVISAVLTKTVLDSSESLAVHLALARLTELEDAIAARDWEMCELLQPRIPYLKVIEERLGWPLPEGPQS